MLTRPCSEVINHDRRQFMATAAMGIAAAGTLSLFPYPALAATSDAIRPFRINVPEEDLVDIRRRVAATRWPDKETVADESQGVPLATIQQLVRYWYGFSAKPTATGWNPARIARAWVVLMKRLGYAQFVSQGGDWGGVVSNVMAEQAPPELLGIHVNFPETIPPEIGKALQSGGPPPSGLSADERRAYEQLVRLRTKQLGYAIEMGTRPQTLYALADSPAGLAAWLLDHGDGYAQPVAAITSALNRPRTMDTATGDLTRDDVLDNITLYWLTNTAVSSARLYWENKTRLLSAVNVSIPAAVSVFPGEIYQAPRSWTERAYHKLIYYNKPDKGGHFAVWEQPELFSVELRAAFRSLRRST